ncbi:hypothetical protein J6590_105278 [Homalodisca vitripennis]|nr:hypothetical protein J6590_105278 [Homalodisca vitripennis]
MRLYSILDSPSARWGLRPQAPMMYASKFGDKRNLIRATTYGLDATEPQTKIYKRKSSKFDKIFEFESMFRVDG